MRSSATTSRRLIVPPGHSSWWGVDPSTRGVSIAWVDGEGRRGVYTAPFAPAEGLARLAEVHAATRAAVGAVTVLHPPGVVLVEQPSGKQDNPALLYAVGAAMAAIYAELREEYGRPIKVETVTSAHWKKVSCGFGAIYKPKRRGDPYGVLEWARGVGYAGGSWDEADALGIAECARREIELLER